ncbi:MAG TPA: hypothetical protein VFF59_09135 [Anaerolineae bacterium]|nr:hypothetical protein [Anaerolineae bacterium]
MTTTDRPITITLTIADSHPIGPQGPPIGYSIPITATGGSVTRYASVSVLISGMKVYLPSVIRN